MKPTAKLTFFISFHLLLSVSGCARLPMTGSLPPGATVTRLATLDSDSPVTWNSAGSHIAYTSDGIRVASATAGDSTRIAAGHATALSWSPDDTRLAAALPDGSRMIVTVFDRSGGVVGKTPVAGHVGRILWRGASELLITATELRNYSFGGNVILRLYRWNGTGAPQETPLENTILKRSTIPLWSNMYRFGADMELSPLQDEIAFTRLIDPPMFPTYLRVVLHHLDSGGERDVAILPFPSEIPVFMPDGEHLLAGNSSAEGALIDTEGANNTPELTESATPISLSTGGANRFSNGHLSISGKGMADFPPECRGFFSPTGSNLALICKSSLYLVAGLPADSISPLPETVRDRLLFLRRLRSERLITNQDYHDQRERILKP